ERDGGSERHRAARDVETRTHGISLLLDAVALALQARAPGLLERVLGRGVLGLRGLLGLRVRLLLGLLLPAASLHRARRRSRTRTFSGGEVAFIAMPVVIADGPDD